MSVEMMWDAWKLCDASREYAKKAGRDVPANEMVEKVFLPSQLVDVERTKRESGNKPTKIFLKLQIPTHSSQGFRREAGRDSDLKPATVPR